MSSNTKSFSISYKDDSGELREGSFTTKRLSIRDRANIGVRRSQLSGGMYCVRDDEGTPTGRGLDADTEFLNSMIAHLEISLDRSPIWWDLEKIADLGLVHEVYAKVAEHEASFFRARDREEDESGQVRAEDSSAERKGPVNTNNPTEVVGKEVSASLDA